MCSSVECLSNLSFAFAQDILEGHQKNPLPAARIKLAKGEVHWFIDEAAASKLTMKVERVHK